MPNIFTAHLSNRLVADGDVRSSSIDRNYMGAPFQGTIAQALQQARAAPAYPLPNAGKAFRLGLSLSRYELLHFLRLV